MALLKYRKSATEFTPIPFFANGTDGWFSCPATITYNTATAPLYTINLDADVTSRVGAGMELKFTQDSTVKKFIIMSITATSAQLYGTSGNTLTTSTITNPYYSPTVPLGYPPSDFVLETLTSGVYTIERYFSGKCVCWGNNTFSNVAVTVAENGVYTSVAKVHTLPTNLFTSILYADVKTQDIGTWTSLVWTNVEVDFRVHLGASYTFSSLVATVYAVGKWK